MQISEAIKASLRLVNSGVETASAHTLAAVLQSNNGTTTLSEYKEIEDTIDTKFKALQYALFSTSFVEILGGVFFLITAGYILRDKSKAEKAVFGKFVFF